MTVPQPRIRPARGTARLLAVAFGLAALAPGSAGAQTADPAAPPAPVPASAAPPLPPVLIAPPPTAADPASLLDDRAFRAEARRGLDALYDMRYAEAAARFDALAAAHPGHPAGPFLQALLPWSRILNDLADTRLDADFHRRMGAVVRLADRRLRTRPDDPDALFLKGAALGFRARLYANRRQYFRAARDGHAALDYVLGVYGRDERRADFSFGRGVYDYYLSAVREDYPRLRPLLALFPHGSRQRGLALLERTFVEGDYLQVEAAYYLAQLNYLHEHDDFAARGYLSWLRSHYPHNATFHAFEGRVLAQMGRWEESEAAWRAVLAAHARGETGYGVGAAEQALYYLGRGAMRRRAYGEALGFFARLQRTAAEREEPSVFAVLGRLRQGMAHDARGERERAVRRYRDVLAMPDASGAHQQARRYLRAPYGR